MYRAAVSEELPATSTGHHWVEWEWVHHIDGVDKHPSSHASPTICNTRVWVVLLSTEFTDSHGSPTVQPQLCLHLGGEPGVWQWGGRRANGATNSASE